MDIFTAEMIVFLILSGLTLSSAAAVVVTRNLMHAGLFLILSLFGVAGLFVLMEAHFLGGVQVVVYIGAIAILIILGVMFTQDVTRIAHTHLVQWPYALALAALFFIGMTLVVSPLADELGANNFNADFTEENPPAIYGGSALENVRELGAQLVDPDAFMLPFEIASVLLMGAMIGAVLLVWQRDDGDDAADEADRVVGQLTTGPGSDLTG